MKIVGIVALLVGLLLILVVVGPVLNWMGKASTVVQEELDPRTLLNRYEWFKDTAARLDSMKANIHVYEARLKNPPTTDRLDREQRNQWTNEVAGLRAAYNKLAAEYNAAMAKINYRFCNAGGLPQGADTVLPREFRSYEQ